MISISTLEHVKRILDQCDDQIWERLSNVSMTNHGVHLILGNWKWFNQKSDDFHLNELAVISLGVPPKFLDVDLKTGDCTAKVDITSDGTVRLTTRVSKRIRESFPVQYDEGIAQAIDLDANYSSPIPF